MHNVNKALKWNNIFFVHGGKKQLKNIPPISSRQGAWSSIAQSCTALGSVYLSHSLNRFMLSLQQDLDADSD